MGVASDYRTPPFPFSSPEELFAAAERWFGTAPFATALASYQADGDFEARQRDPEAMAQDIESLYDGLELPDYAAGMVARVRSLPVAEPFPGVAVPVQSTAATVA